jgi:hypothetical protein
VRKPRKPRKPRAPIGLSVFDLYWMVAQSDLSATEKSVATAIVMHMNPELNGLIAWPSHGWLAMLTSLDLSTVKKILRSHPVGVIFRRVVAEIYKNPQGQTVVPRVFERGDEIPVLIGKRVDAFRMDPEKVPGIDTYQERWRKLKAKKRGRRGVRTTPP